MISAVLTLRTRPYKLLILAFLPRNRRAEPAAAASAVSQPAGGRILSQRCVSTAPVRVRGGAGGYGGGGEPIGPLSLTLRPTRDVGGGDG